MRRRGYPASALRKLCELIGVTKVPTSVIEYSLLENCVRDSLQEEVPTKMLCVLRPLRVTVTNWPEDVPDEMLEVPEEDESMPERRLHFGRQICIDAEDFQEVPEPGFKRLSPGQRVKLRYGYVLQCEDVVRGVDGQIEEIQCSYDPDSLGKRPPKKVGVIHWAHPKTSVPVSVRLYDRIFEAPRPEEDGLDPSPSENSLERLEGALCESSLLEWCRRHQASHEAAAAPKPIFKAQFERCGFFALDDKASELQSNSIVFNRIVAQRNDFKAPPKTPRQARKQPNKKKSKGNDESKQA